MEITIPGMDRKQAEELVAGRARRLPVFERDPRQHRRRPERGLRRSVGIAADRPVARTGLRCRQADCRAGPHQLQHQLDPGLHRRQAAGAGQRRQRHAGGGRGRPSGPARPARRMRSACCARTATPACPARSSGASRPDAPCRCRCRRPRCRARRRRPAASISRASAPAWLVTISTQGQSAASRSAPGGGHAGRAPSGQARNSRKPPCSTTPIGPASPLPKASRR